MTANELLGRGTLEAYLLARHRAIDALLERAIDEGGVSQVIEVAAGLSPRGWRFTERYGERLTYVEADLPGMAARKRRALERIGSLSERHRIVVLDALRDDGPESLAALTERTRPDQGPGDHHRGAAGLPGDATMCGPSGGGSRLRSAASPVGRYISDIHLASVADLQVRAFRVLLSAFVRGRVYLHFDSAEDVVAALLAAGFA